MKVAVGEEGEVGLGEGSQGMGMVLGEHRLASLAFPLGMTWEWQVADKGEVGLVGGTG